MLTLNLRPLWVLSFAMVILSGCESPQEERAEAYEKGVGFMKQHQYDAAMIAFKNAVKADPKDAPSLYQLGLVYLELGDGEKALIEMEKAKAIKADLPGYPLAEAHAYFLQGKLAEAEKRLQPLIASDIKAKALAGQVFLRKGDLNTARAYLEAALAQQVEPLRDLLGLAEIELQQQQPAKARALLERAAKADVAAVQPSLALAQLDLLEGKRAEAEKRLQAAVKAHPGEPQPQSMLTRLLLQNMRSKEALEASERMVKQFGGWDQSHMLKALSHLYLEQVDPAILSFEEALKRNPDNVQTRYYYAVALWRKGRLEQASTATNEVLKVAPKAATVQTMLAMIRLQQGMNEEAISQARNIISANPDFAMAHYVLGLAQMAKGQTEAGLESMNHALELDPQVADAATRLGNYYALTGQPQKAEQIFDSAIAANPGKTNVRISKALNLLRQKQPQAAIDELIIAQKQEPNNPRPDHIRAGVLFSQGKADEAVAVFNSVLKREPDYTPSRMALATIALRKKDPDAAVRQYDAILKAHPDYTPALLAKGNLALSRGKKEEAQKVFAEAAHAQKSLAAYQSLVGELLRDKKIEAALTEAEAASKAFPQSAPALQLLGLAKMNGKDIKGAEAAFLQSVKLAGNKSADGYQGLGDFYLSQKRLPDAANAYQQAIKLEPNRGNLYVRLAEIQNAQGQTAAAEKTLRITIDKAPKNPAAHAVLADFYLQSRRPDQAISHYQQAQKLLGKPDTTLLLRLGNAYYAKGDAKSGAAQMRQALAIDPKLVIARFTLASAAEAAGDRATAESEYRKILEQVPNYAPALNNLAYLYASQNRNLEQAQRYVDSAIKVAPQDLTLQDTLGWLQYRRGQHAAAVKTLSAVANKLDKEANVQFHLGAALIANGQKAQGVAAIQQALKLNPNFSEAAEAKALLAKNQ